MDMRMKTVTVFDANDEFGTYGKDWPPRSANNFVAWFQSKLDLIPEEFRDTATINVETQHGYDDSRCLAISITYNRLETDEEFSARKHEEKERARLSVENDLRILSELKAKYETGDDRGPTS